MTSDALAVWGAHHAIQLARIGQPAALSNKMPGRLPCSTETANPIEMPCTRRSIAHASRTALTRAGQLLWRCRVTGPQRLPRFPRSVDPPQGRPVEPSWNGTLPAGLTSPGPPAPRPGTDTPDSAAGQMAAEGTTYIPCLSICHLRSPAGSQTLRSISMQSTSDLQYREVLKTEV